MARSSETRVEVTLARELLETRGWSSAHPPRGNLLWKNEYRDDWQLTDALKQASKKGGGAGYPDFFLVDARSGAPLIVGEAKASVGDLDQASHEACDIYGEALFESGHSVLAAAIAGDGENEIAVEIKKRGRKGWEPIEYRGEPIQWLPTPEETSLLLKDKRRFELQPKVPSAEVLARRGEEINRIFRECGIRDELRPAVMGAFMLALVESGGSISHHPEVVLMQVNKFCQNAFRRAGKHTIAESIMVPEANDALSSKAARIIHILRLLNVTTLTAEHDYVGQLYEMFFRFTGGNTIGQFFTPRHISQFMADLTGVGPNDDVLDPTCGTGGFLIASLYRMIGNRHLTKDQVSALVAKHLRGFESEPITAALCVANMILRGDGTTGIVAGDTFTHDSYPERWASIVLGNPPFPHKSTDKPTEAFVDRALEALRARGQLAMVLPISIVHKSGKKQWREKTLRGNTLVGVIELPGELFEPYASSTTAIVILKKGVKHDWKKPVFFCRIANDGFRLKKSARIDRPGEQLTEAMRAYESRESIPGFCTWAPLVGNDWGPGGFIESSGYDEDDIREQVELVLRSDAAFHSLYANKLNEFKECLDDGRLVPGKYSNISNKRPRPVDELPGTIGHYFNIYYGQRDLHSKENLVRGESLIISSSGTNNGCYGFYQFPDLIQPPFVTIPGTGSIGEAYVQTWPCGVTDHCLLLIPRYGTPEEMLWLAAAVVRLEQWRFNYGRGITAERIANFALPVSGRKLRAWVRVRRGEVSRLNESVLNSFSQDAIGSKFRRLADDWLESRPKGVDVAQMTMHSAYQQIIGMGDSAVPYLLKELKRKPDHWFWALHAITGHNPVPDDKQGKTKDMAKAWLQWGRNNGYIA